MESKTVAVDWQEPLGYPLDIAKHPAFDQGKGKTKLDDKTKSLADK